MCGVCSGCAAACILKDIVWAQSLTLCTFTIEFHSEIICTSSIWQHIVNWNGKTKGVCIDTLVLMFWTSTLQFQYKTLMMRNFLWICNLDLVDVLSTHAWTLNIYVVFHNVYISVEHLFSFSFFNWLKRVCNFTKCFWFLSNI